LIKNLSCLIIYELFIIPPLPIFVMADEISCPYCESIFENKEDLSKHIDRIHHGSGLLEGDSRKF